MAGNTDPQRRPVYVDRVNQRLLADPIGAGAWPVVPLSYSMLGEISANTLIGRTGSAGPAQELSADVVVDLINAATGSVIAAARVTAGSTTTSGVVQLTDSTTSTSVTTAATPNSVKIAADTAAAALPKAGGTLTGALTLAADPTQSLQAASKNYVDTADAALLPKAGGTMTGAITFASGQAYPQIPQNSKTSAYTLVAGDAGRHISITTGGITVPAGVFNVGDAISIYNNSANSQTITQGASTTLRLAGSAASGNRAIAQYGLGTILCVASNVFAVSGAGVS
jgi:hypothetical protein